MLKNSQVSFEACLHHRSGAVQLKGCVVDILKRMNVVNYRALNETETDVPEESDVSERVSVVI